MNNYFKLILIPVTRTQCLSEVTFRVCFRVNVTTCGRLLEGHLTVSLPPLLSNCIQRSHIQLAGGTLSPIQDRLRAKGREVDKTHKWGAPVGVDGETIPFRSDLYPGWRIWAEQPRLGSISSRIRAGIQVRAGDRRGIPSETARPPSRRMWIHDRILPRFEMERRAETGSTLQNPSCSECTGTESRPMINRHSCFWIFDTMAVDGISWHPLCEWFKVDDCHDLFSIALTDNSIAKQEKESKRLHLRPHFKLLYFFLHS